jgi:hypothetical protein
MLRIAVISLFVANLLLLGFQASQPAVQKKAVVRQAVVEDTNIPTIHLFNEMMQDQGLMSDNRRCFSLGPFHSSEDMVEARGRLQQVSTSISERETQALVEKGYWVFLPPYDSLLEANQALFSLQGLGLEDVGVIYDGGWKNAISTGYFLRQENALRRKKGLEDRGYAPLIRVQRMAEPRFWLDYEQSPGSGLIALDMQNRPNDFMQRALPCPEQNPFDMAVVTKEEPADEPLQVQAQIQAPEESSILQSVESAGIDLEESVDNVPVDSNAAAPGQLLETGPTEDNGNGSESNTESEPEISLEAETDDG